MSLRLDGDDDGSHTDDHYGWLFPADLAARALKSDLAAVGMVQSYGHVNLRAVPGGAFRAALRQTSANGKSLLLPSLEDAALGQARYAFTRAHGDDDARRIIVRVALRDLRWLPPSPGSRRAAEEGGALLALAPPAAGP